MDEIPAIIDKTPFVHGHVSGNLLHPLLIRMRGDAGDLDLAALKMDKEQYIISDQPSQRQHLHRVKVSPRKDSHVRVDEVCPRLRA
jgi:hypothetical protein